MEYWEFLLQQEGDSNWLPLDTSQMEILEGRYRIMAHCSQAQTSIDVHVSHVFTEQVPPKRRSLKRQGQTNENGLMVVLPFTRLTAGTWDIHCKGISTTGDVAAEANPQPPSDTWHYAIQLRVLSQDAGEDGDWFADDGSSQPLLAEAISSPEPSNPPPPATEQAATPTPTLRSRLDLQQVAEAMDQTQVRLVNPKDDLNFLYSLKMPQTALMAVQGQPIQLSGQAAGVVEEESCSDMALVVRLSNPQTAEVLTLAPFALSATTLPSPFSLVLPLPNPLSTRLLLGELALISWQAGTANVLAMARFTVTVDLAALFDEIANQAEADAEPELVFAPDKLGDDNSLSNHNAASLPETSEGWAKVNFPVAPVRSMPTLTLPRSNPTIPPKIYYPSPHEASARTPALPPLGQAKPGSVAPVQPPQIDQVEPDQATGPLAGGPLPASAPADEGSAGAATEASPTNPAAKLTPKLSLPPLKSPAAGSSSAEAKVSTDSTPADGIDRAADKAQSSPSQETLLLPSHETVAFQALNLQERFWNRLNDLAVTIQQEAQATREAEEPAEPLPEDESPEEPPFIPFEGEVVIYEEDSPAATVLIPATAAELVSRLEQGDEAELVTPPKPEIDIAATELMAGDSVLVTLRVPFHPNRLYLKVWMTDPQTRSLTDEPRQITHLVPNGRGQLEGNIQLTVPMGCLEAWFEAISVDMVTQQESYKASVSRSINPPGLEDSSSLEEFDI
jgi:hypothetical protein